MKKLRIHQAGSQNPLSSASSAIANHRPVKSVAPARALTRPHAKWSVVAAFIISIALHISTVLIMEPPDKQTRAGIAEATENGARAAGLD
jgi:hypothetical protein